MKRKAGAKALYDLCNVCGFLQPLVIHNCKHGTCWYQQEIDAGAVLQCFACNHKYQKKSTPATYVDKYSTRAIALRLCNLAVPFDLRALVALIERHIFW